MRAELRAEIVELLREEVSRSVSMRSWSRAHGLDHTYVWQVLSGRRPPSDRIVTALRITLHASDPRGQHVSGSSDTCAGPSIAGRT